MNILKNLSTRYYYRCYRFYYTRSSSYISSIALMNPDIIISARSSVISSIYHFPLDSTNFIITSFSIIFSLFNLCFSFIVSTNSSSNSSSLSSFSPSDSAKIVLNTSPKDSLINFPPSIYLTSTLTIALLFSIYESIILYSIFFAFSFKYSDK